MRSAEWTPRESRGFDVVVFGASGFTGQYIVERLATTAIAEQIRWAVAGRDRTKLRNTLDEASKYTGIDVRDTTTIIADVADEASIVNMCRRTRLVLNCVGPYILYGEVVVKSCIDNNTDHLDMSGERYYVNSMQLKYNEDAKKAGVYILGSAGLSSLPTEVGLQFLRRNFEGDISYTETIMNDNNETHKDTGHYATFQSYICDLKMSKEMQEQRRQLFADKLPVGYVQGNRRDVIYSKEVGKWCATNRSLDCTSENSDYYNYHQRNMSPMNNKLYVSGPSFFGVLLIYLFAEYVHRFIAMFACGRRLLRKYHSTLTDGFFSKQGPSREMLLKRTTTITFIGHGYSKGTAKDEGQVPPPPDKRLVVTIDGPEGGYLGTGVFMTQTAFCILNERDKLPKTGGVLPIGAALQDTTIIKRLQNNGYKFAVRADL